MTTKIHSKSDQSRNEKSSFFIFARTFFQYFICCSLPMTTTILNFSFSWRRLPSFCRIFFHILISCFVFQAVREWRNSIYLLHHWWNFIQKIKIPGKRMDSVKISIDCHRFIVPTLQAGCITSRWSGEFFRFNRC